jgi:hypothetical protein
VVLLLLLLLLLLKTAGVSDEGPGAGFGTASVLG